MTLPDGIHPGLDAATYYADPCKVPSLTQSIANTILNYSPLHAWLQHPRLGGQPRVPTKAMDVGTICHALLLNQPLPKIRLIHYDNYRTDAAKADKKAAESAGEIPMLGNAYGEWENLKGAAETLRDKIHAKGIRFDGDSEVTIAWNHDGVQCRMRMDHLCGYDGFDLKFGASANPKSIDKSARNLGYDVQGVAYEEGIGEAGVNMLGRSTFTLIFCEVEAPYCVTLARFSAIKRHIGEAKWNYARSVWRRCLERNEWPEYVPGLGIHMIEATAWEMKEAEQYGIECA
jgi:hypothetical protein